MILYYIFIFKQVKDLENIAIIFLKTNKGISTIILNHLFTSFPHLKIEIASPSFKWDHFIE